MENFMTKTAYTDGCWVMIHFNSSVQAYNASRDLGPYSIECCYCHNMIQVIIPREIGQNYKIRCRDCGKECEYTTLLLSEPLAMFFNVRGGAIYGSPLLIGGVMHVALPDHHQEFDSIISSIINRGIPSDIYIDSEWPILDVFSSVMEDIRGYYATKVREIPRDEGTIVKNRHIFALSNGFEHFGDIIRMHRIHYSDAQLSRLEDLNKEILIETNTYLVSLFNKHKRTQISDIYLNLINYCYDYIKMNYGKKILEIMNSK